METRPAGEEVGRFGGSKKLPVNARGGSDRPGYRRPECGGRTEPPIHSAAGLELKPGVVVVFDLCAQRQVEAVGAHGDLVLDEPGEPLALAASQSMRNPPCPKCHSSAASRPLGNAVASRPKPLP